MNLIVVKVINSNNYTILIIMLIEQVFILYKSKTMTLIEKDFLFVDMFDEYNDKEFLNINYLKSFDLKGCTMSMDGKFERT